MGKALFFIIVALLIVAVIALLALLALLFKIDLLIEVHDKEASLTVRTLGIVFVHRKYEIKREKVEIFTLYCVDKPQPKRVISLLDLIKTAEKKKRKPKSNEMARGKLFLFINSKSEYKLNFRFDIGLDDAFATAMLCGLAQSTAGALAAVIKDRRHSIHVSAHPVFPKRSFSWFADCIIKLSLANIIIGYLIYKINKGR